MGCVINAESVGSTGLKKDNTLRQFNYHRVLGVPMSSGIIPVIYRVMLRRKKCCVDGEMKVLDGHEGVRAVVYYDGTYEDSCRWYEQTRHDMDCSISKIYKHDGLESYEKDVDCCARSECAEPYEPEKETRFKRKNGRALLNYNYHRTWYEGCVMHKAPYRLENCSKGECCYSYNEEDNSPKEIITKDEIAVSSHTPVHRKVKTGCSSCGRR